MNRSMEDNDEEDDEEVHDEEDDEEVHGRG